jgi:putative membrane protein
MPHVLIAAVALALAAAAAIQIDLSFADVAGAIALAGWGILLIVAIRFGVTLLLAVAWRFVMPAGSVLPFHECVTLRLIRDGVNGLLPSAQIGGDVIGARLMAQSRPAPAAAASVVVDVFVQTATQFLFTAAGVGVLVWLGVGGPVAAAVGWGLAIAAPLLVGFLVFQHQSSGELVLRALRRLSNGREWRAIAAADAFYEAVAAIRRIRGGFAGSGAMHLLAWLAGSAEVYIALYFMGHPVGIAEAIVIESLAHAVRSAAFAVPGAVGVQEGGFVVLCALFGVPAEPAIALSLVKRIADLALGAPGIAIWLRREWRPPATSIARAPSTES